MGKIASKIIRNTKFNFLSYVWQALVALFLTPFIISHLGIERYGIWAISFAIVGFLGIADFGFSAAFTKYIAEYFAKQDFDAINRIVNTGLIFYVVQSLIIGSITFVFANLILSSFSFAESLQDEAIFVLRVAIIIFMFKYSLCVFGGVLSGLQKYDLVSKVSIFQTIPTVLGTVWVLQAGYGLKGLILVNAGVNMLRQIAFIFLSYRMLPRLSFDPSKAGITTLRQLFHYGWKIQIANFGTLLGDQVNKLILGSMLNITMVGFYQIGDRAATMLRNFPQMMISAIMPTFSELNSLDDKRKMQTLFYSGTKYVVLITIGLGAFIILTAPEIILAWLGKTGYEKSYWTLQLLIFGWFFSIVTTGILSNASKGLGKPEYNMKRCVVEAVFNILLTFLFIMKFGFIGAPVGCAMSSLIGSFYFVSIFYKNESQFSLSKILKLYQPPIVGCVLAAVPAWVIAKGLFVFSLNSIRLNNITMLTLEAIIFFSTYAGFLILVGYVGKSDFVLLADNSTLLRKI